MILGSDGQASITVARFWPTGCAFLISMLAKLLPHFVSPCPDGPPSGLLIRRFPVRSRGGIRSPPKRGRAGVGHLTRGFDQGPIHQWTLGLIPLRAARLMQRFASTTLGHLVMSQAVTHRVNGPTPLLGVNQFGRPAIFSQKGWIKFLEGGQRIS